MGLVVIWCVSWNVRETSETKSCVVMRTSWQECAVVVHRALLGFQSDRTPGYKTPHGLRAFNESLTTQSTPLPLYSTLIFPLNMHSTNNNQFRTSRGNTISCPVGIRPDSNLRTFQLYPTPQEVGVSSSEVFFRGWLAPYRPWRLQARLWQKRLAICSPLAWFLMTRCLSGMLQKFHSFWWIFLSFSTYVLLSYFVRLHCANIHTPLPFFLIFTTQNIKTRNSNPLGAREDH